MHYAMLPVCYYLTVRVYMYVLTLYYCTFYTAVEFGHQIYSPQIIKFLCICLETLHVYVYVYLGTVVGPHEMSCLILT